MDTASLIAATSPTIGAVGSAFYFTPETVGRGKALGLDGFRFYVLGRGGVLGDAEAPVVASAFGWWNGALVAKMWESARAQLAPREAGRIYHECAADLGRAKLAGVEDLSGFCLAAEQIIGAADPAGLALFAGIAAEPLAEDLPGRALQLVAVLREFRGSAHIVAVRAAGLPMHLAHFIRRPDMYKSFGWGETAPDVDDGHRQELDHAESLTDLIVTPAFASLGADQAAAFVSGVDRIKAAFA